MRNLKMSKVLENSESEKGSWSDERLKIMYERNEYLPSSVRHLTFIKINLTMRLSFLEEFLS